MNTNRMCGIVRAATVMASVLGLAMAGCNSTGGVVLPVEHAYGGLVDSSVATSDADASDLSVIEAYWTADFYATTDIQHSFETASGTHFDCIDFYAQNSVKTLVANGLPLAPPPPTSIVPPAAASAHLQNAITGGVDGTIDSGGSVRSCPVGTVPKIRPSVAEIEAKGGVAAYKQFERNLPRPQNAQNSVEHDCWNNNYALNFSSSDLPPANYCSTWVSDQGAGACGNYDHAVGIQNGSWQPSARLNGHTYYSSGYYGLSSITPVYHPTVDSNDFEGHVDSQLWMQTGTCDNWYNGNNARSGQQCNVGSSCTSASCAVQSIELGWMANSNSSNIWGFVFFTPDGYYTGCYSYQGGSACPDGVQPYVEVASPYYVPNPSNPITASTPGSTPNELPLEIWNGSAQGLPYFYVFMFGQYIGWYPNTIFNWPTGEGSGAGPMVDGPATYAQVGGEVFQQWPYADGASWHSQSSMCSNYPPADGYKYAAYQRNVAYLDSESTFHNASLSFLQEPTVPSYMGDYSSPGICGYLAGRFVTENDVALDYAISTTTAPASGETWDTYFYYGTE
jgi:hypothetical protein